MSDAVQRNITSDTNADLEQDTPNAPLGTNEAQAFTAPVRIKSNQRRGNTRMRTPAISGPDKAKQEEQRACRDCKENKPLSKYGKDSAYRDGLSTRCRSCKAASDRKSYRKRNPNKTRVWHEERRMNHAARIADIKKTREWRENNLKRTMIHSARKRGACTLETKDIFIPERCPVLGIKLIRSAVGDSNRDSSPSLDRINPLGDYTTGNVWVISYRANRIKNNATIQELEKLVDALKELRDGTFQVTSQDPHPTYQGTAS